MKRLRKAVSPDRHEQALQKILEAYDVMGNGVAGLSDAAEKMYKIAKRAVQRSRVGPLCGECGCRAHGNKMCAAADAGGGSCGCMPRTILDQQAKFNLCFDLESIRARADGVWARVRLGGIKAGRRSRGARVVMRRKPGY